MSSVARYLLLHGSHKKKVEFNLDEGAKVTTEALREKVVTVFSIDKAELQVWDRDFEDWVDLEDGDEVETNSKVTVKEIQHRDCSTPTPSLNSDIDVDLSVSKSVSSGSSSSTSSDTCNRSSSCSTSQLLRNRSSAWISSYTLPNFSAALQEKLSEGETLKEGQRSALLEAIYISVTRFTFYPTSVQYRRIIDLLFERFPRLAHQPNMTMDNAKALWKNRLLYKFANARKREDQNVDVVITRKRKLPVDGRATSQLKGGPPQWGVRNYQPERPSSEDDVSIQVHIDWMKMEKPKKKPNYERVAIAMEATLADRRKLITKDLTPIAIIRETYPWLFEEEEILSEFKRLHGQDTGIVELLEEGLKKYANPIQKLCNPTTKLDSLHRQALDIIPLQRNESARKEATSVAAIIGIPVLLREKVGSMLLLAQDRDDGAPYINANDPSFAECTEFVTIVDGVEVAQSNSFLSAMSVYLSTFYVFNLAYPANLKKTLTFFQKIILNIQDNVKIERAVVSLLEKLNCHLDKQ